MQSCFYLLSVLLPDNFDRDMGSFKSKNRNVKGDTQFSFSPFRATNLVAAGEFGHFLVTDMGRSVAINRLPPFLQQGSAKIGVILPFDERDDFGMERRSRSE